VRAVTVLAVGVLVLVRLVRAVESGAERAFVRVLCYSDSRKDDR
jgi:hypothetical protein